MKDSINYTMARACIAGEKPKFRLEIYYCYHVNPTTIQAVTLKDAFRKAFQFMQENPDAVLKDYTGTIPPNYYELHEIAALIHIGDIQI